MPAPRLARALSALDALVNWERRERRGMRVGLAPMADLVERLGRPHRRFRAVHVTGTKGKGTTAALVAAGLGRTGARVGLYTSPHVERVNERIRIAGAEIEDEALAEALEQALAARAEAISAGTPADEATWFDVVTAAAFLAFARASCDWAVVEVGIGGRLDSTNVVDGEVAIVTNVDLEHVQVLGGTRAAIAREKGGIVKRGATLVTGVVPVAGSTPEDDAAGVLGGIARDLGVRVLRPSAVATDLLQRDVDLARLALDELGRRGVRDAQGEAISGSLLDDATIASARLAGRQELRSKSGVPVLLDGAHVASSVEAVLAEAARDPRLPRRRPVVVLGLGRDKDAPAILKALAGGADRLVCTTAASGPLRAVEVLAEESLRAGIDAETAPDPPSALAKAILLAAGGGWVLVTGSFHVVGATRPLLDAPNQDPRPRC
jgi:dihydrofolate synthase/folylpolyglutamate synthase